jgi:hypothetical protein
MTAEVSALGSGGFWNSTEKENPDYHQWLRHESAWRLPGQRGSYKDQQPQVQEEQCSGCLKTLGPAGTISWLLVPSPDGSTISISPTLSNMKSVAQRGTLPVPVLCPWSVLALSSASLILTHTQNCTQILFILPALFCLLCSLIASSNHAFSQYLLGPSYSWTL